MEETKTVFLSDKRKVVLEDDDDLILSLVSDDKAESRFEVMAEGGLRFLHPGTIWSFLIFQVNVKKDSV